MVDYSDIPVLNALKNKMHWLNTNQKVISENIAHANTPGYRAKELKQQDFSGLVEQLSNDNAGPQTASFEMKITDPRHIGGSGGNGVHYTVNEVEGNEESPNGNSVVLEEEMIKLADNQMEYSMAAKLYKKNMMLIKSALGKGAR